MVLTVSVKSLRSTLRVAVSVTPACKPMLGITGKCVLILRLHSACNTFVTPGAVIPTCHLFFVQQFRLFSAPWRLVLAVMPCSTILEEPQDWATACDSPT